MGMNDFSVSYSCLLFFRLYKHPHPFVAVDDVTPAVPVLGSYTNICYDLHPLAFEFLKGPISCVFF